MVCHLRRSLGLLLLLGLGSGCYGATFREYVGKDADPPDTQEMEDTSDSSPAMPEDAKVSPGDGGSPDGPRG